MVTVAIHSQGCRACYFSAEQEQLQLKASIEFSYTGTEDIERQLADWSKQNQLKNIPCRWVLERELYQTFNIAAPKVLEKEMSQALKWQIKDLINLPLDDVLLSYYKPHHPDSNNDQIVTVAVERSLVESLIFSTQNAGLTLQAIEIEELLIGQALMPKLSADKVIGYVGEDRNGLTFYFYQGDKLAFSRHKKGYFMPSASEDELSLETDQQAKQDAFLLETQRTMDYVVSQLFRKPVDTLYLDQQSGENAALLEIITQITDTPVASFSLPVDTQQTDMVQPSLAELGCLIGAQS